MPLKLYRRHRPDCEAGHPEDHRSGEFEEGRRGWKRCACTIHAAGTLGGKFSRRQTFKSDWEEAKVIAAQWEARASWDIPVPAAPPKPTNHPVGKDRTSISDAVEAYLSRCRNRGIEQSTLAKYRTFTKQLLSYCHSQGYVYLDQLSVSDMDAFYASWADGKRAKAKKLERLKSFVKFCIKRKWLEDDIAEDLEAPEGSSVPANKSPFTDEELKRIYAACDAIRPKPPGPGHRQWSGQDVKDFIMLSIHTGLRISDVATFDISKRLRGNDVFLRMHKTGKELYTWIPDWLVQRLEARQKKYGNLIFQTGDSQVMRTMAELWRAKLKQVFPAAGPWQEPPTPHRLRHTFVRILLEKGVLAADVAELIGDTEAVLRKHYSKWMPARQERLTRILKDAFADQPKL